MSKTTPYQIGDDAIPAPLDWTVPTSRIPASGLDLERTATVDERQASSDVLPVQDITALAVKCRIEPVMGSTGHFRLTGRLMAELAQTCSVTLEPMRSALKEDFACLFTPQPALETASSSEEDELSILDLEDIEPLENDTIPFGRIVFETLVAGIDPYPRKTDESGVWDAGWAEDGRSDNPFAALAILQSKTSDKP